MSALKRRWFPLLLAMLTAMAANPTNAAAPMGADNLAPNPLVHMVAIDDGTPGRTPFSDDTVRFSALVSRIQEVLKQLGLYNGPVDGAMAPTTERAIRIYESQVELPVTGQPSRELLDHLETVGRANRLLVRLDESRDRKQQRARKLLSTSDLAAKLGVTQVAVANPLRDPTPCFAQPSPRCLLDEALESAKAVADTKFRDWALGDIAVARAAAGLEDDVYRTIALIDDPRLIVAALRDAGVAWADAGMTVAAREIASGLQDAESAAEVTAALALAEARNGDAQSLGRVLGELMAYANQAGSSSTMATLLARVAPRLQAAGADRAARDVIDVALQAAEGAALGGSERDRVLGEIGAVLATLGETDRARALMAEIGDAAERRPILIALAEESVTSGDADAAMRAASDVTDRRYRVIALTDIAIAHARAGNIEAAWSSIDRARSDTEEIDKRFTYARAFAVSRIAAALAEARGYDDAADTAAKIEDRGLRAQSLWHLASLQARDEHQASEKTRSMALQAAADIASELDRAWTLARLALSSARRGEWELARDTMDAALTVGSEIDNSFARASALAKLASTLIQMERLSENR